MFHLLYHLSLSCLCMFLMIPSDFCVFCASLFTAVHSSTPVINSPWTAPPSSSNASNPWPPRLDSRTDPWEAAPVSCTPVNHEWDSPTDGGTCQEHLLTVTGSINMHIHWFVVFCVLFDIQVMMGQIHSLHRKRRSLNKKFLKCPPLNLLAPQVVQYRTYRITMDLTVHLDLTKEFSLLL